MSMNLVAPHISFPSSRVFSLFSRIMHSTCAAAYCMDGVFFVLPNIGSYLGRPFLFFLLFASLALFISFQFQGLVFSLSFSS